MMTVASHPPPSQKKRNNTRIKMPKQPPIRSSIADALGDIGFIAI